MRCWIVGFAADIVFFAVSFLVKTSKQCNHGQHVEEEHELKSSGKLTLFHHANRSMYQYNDELHLQSNKNHHLNILNLGPWLCIQISFGTYQLQ